MSFIFTRHDPLAALTERVHHAEAASTELLSSVIEAVSRRTSAEKETWKNERLETLGKAGAFTDAALLLIARDLPQWQLRRLACDDGTWHCALARRGESPDWLNEAVEAHHADMTLALICAYLEAGQQREPEVDIDRSPRRHTGHFETLCCENFR